MWKASKYLKHGYNLIPIRLVYFLILTLGYPWKLKAWRELVGRRLKREKVALRHLWTILSWVVSLISLTQLVHGIISWAFAVWSVQYEQRPLASKPACHVPVSPEAPLWGQESPTETQFTMSRGPSIQSSGSSLNTITSGPVFWVLHTWSLSDTFWIWRSGGAFCRSQQDYKQTVFENLLFSDLSGTFLVLSSG